MSRTHDEQFNRLSHAYELGMLSDAEEEEFEMLLMKHPEYFERMEQLDDATLLIKYDPEAREIISQVLGEQADPATDGPAPARRFWPRFWPAWLAAAAVLLIFFLLNWEINIRPTPEAVAVENRLAVMYFDNLADPEDPQRYGEIIASLLISDLSESHYLQVVSSQRLYDILKFLDKEGAKILDRETATEVALNAQAQTMLMGDILQVEPYLIITTQLVDVPSGRLIAAYRVDGEPGEDIFALVDRTTVSIKTELSLPQAARDEPDPRVADITTYSADAYRHYIAGLDLALKLYTREAAAEFTRALEYDSTFAMAYFQLAMLDDDDKLLKAVQYAENATQKERLYIDAMYAYYAGELETSRALWRQLVDRYPDEKYAYHWAGVIHHYHYEIPEAIRYLEKAVAIDPLFKVGYNDLAFAYRGAGDLDRAMQTIDKYIALAPDESNPYDSKAMLLAQSGRIDEAIAVLRTALAVKPDFAPSQAKLGAMYIFKQEYARAESVFQEMLWSDEPSSRLQGRTLIACISLYQGKFEEALRLLNEGLAAENPDAPTTVLQKEQKFALIVRMTIYLELGRFDLAQVDAQKCREYFRKTSLVGRNLVVWYPEVWVHTRSGRFDQAEPAANALREAATEKSALTLYHRLASGYLEFYRGDPLTAAEHFTQAGKEFPLPGIFYYPPSHGMLARSLLETGRFDDAIGEFEKLRNEYSVYRVIWGLWDVQNYYYLGQAYEKNGQYAKAREQYETFLNIWRNADSGIAEVEDAKIRLDNLKKRL